MHYFVHRHLKKTEASASFQKTECSSAYGGVDASISIRYDLSNVTCNYLCGLACMVSRANLCHGEDMVHRKCKHTPYSGDARDGERPVFVQWESYEEYGPSDKGYLETNTNTKFLPDKDSKGKYFCHINGKKYEMNDVTKKGMPLLPCSQD